MVLCVVIVTLSLPKHARFKYEYAKGKVWMNKDLVSPYSFAIEKTFEETERDKADIYKSILPVYQNDTEVASNEQQAFIADFDVRWESAVEDEKLKEAYKETGGRILEAVYQRGVMAYNKRHQQGNSNYNFNLLTGNRAVQTNTAVVFTIETALRYVEEQVEKATSIRNKAWLIKLISDHIQQNYIYDERLSSKIEEEALKNLSPTRGMVQKGELIIANGNIITQDVYQKLESLKNTYEDDSKFGGDRKIIFFGQLLLGGLIVTLLMIFLRLFRKDIFEDNRKISLILVVITVMLVSLSWAISLKIPNLYYIPYCIVPIIIRILFDTRLALNIHLLVVLVAGFFVPNSFEFAFLQVTSGMVAIYSIKNLVKREQFLISALLILTNYFVAYLGISLIRNNGTMDSIEWENFVPFIFSVLLSLLAYPLIYAFERVFGLTSEVTLMEITNTNSKLLRELSYKAPGTFQHSLQVANLAEAAIFNVGGNALLVRAGALYHDIGKMENPQYFIENQNKGQNPHDSLSYEASAQIIIRHVTKGAEIARKNHLPELVIDFIRTHHGNTRMDYFYQSFLKNFPEKFVDENIFRYPGPIPFSKETGVLMLADSVEAASRSLKEPDAQSISNLVDRIIDYKLEQGQLNNSNITLKDIATIRTIFKNMLMSIYHVRIDYEI
ncbi:HD family phosphohydrolase [Pararcticibacter amylolyticus]|uniref:Transmembrane HD family protein n=1 Tax=Pararcticibacter amylolyticus TaxID=2173175 RepID=A0A2U2PBB1_9SPHI|nr:HDIG domain-containing metalloprotein [Pararcticibacter amylolyticus]PWG78645.1 transmembrane HD family protein [Pararcticibacter amylolyticus]